MKVLTNEDYYHILLQGCKEAFESLEAKEYFYSKEAMFDVDQSGVLVTEEHLKRKGYADVVVNNMTGNAVNYYFLKFLERQQLILKKDYFIEKYDFYKRCLTSLNIKLTEYHKREGRKPQRSLSDMGDFPDPLEYLENMKWDIKHKSLKSNDTPEPQQNETGNINEVKKNEYGTIFKNDIGFNIFTKMFELYKNEKSHLANFSFLFYAMENDFLVCSQTEFRGFLRNEKYNIEIEKIDSRQSGKNKKTLLYNSIKEKFQTSTIKAQ